MDNNKLNKIIDSAKMNNNILDYKEIEEFNEEEISIIIEDLSSNYIYEPNLVSYLNQNTELINYELDSDTMLLNFNTSIFMDDKEILEEVVYSISYSVFDNYDVEEVVFRVNNEEILKKTLKDIEIIK